MFITFFYFAIFFIFKNVHWKYHLKSLSKQRKQIGSVWLFFFVPMLEFPYRQIYWQALLFTYRIGLHQMTPLGVVFLFMLVNWWVEKHQRFLFNVYKRFFVTFLRLLTFLNFFLDRFLHLWNLVYVNTGVHGVPKFVTIGPRSCGQEDSSFSVSVKKISCQSLITPQNLVALLDLALCGIPYSWKTARRV